MEARKKKMKKKNPTSLLSLPDEILLNCLARTFACDYRSLSLVSKSTRSLVSSPELYTTRSWIGNSEPYLYICQQLPTCVHWYALDRTLITNGCVKDKTSLLPIIMPSSCSKSSTAVAVGFEIYQIGGTINADNQLSSAVRVLDCRRHTWRDAPNMMVARKRPKAAFIDGKIYVIGGKKESMNWAEVFDLKTQTWKPFSSPSDVDPKVLLSGGKLYVKSGHKSYAYDSKQETWKEILEEESGLGPEPTNGPWCVIEENLKLNLVHDKFRWYDSERRKWFLVMGLKDLYLVICFRTTTVRLASFGGKLLILWDKPQPLIDFPVMGKRQKHCSRNKTIWCAMIRLEKRIGFCGLGIWGEIERLNPLLTLPDTYKVLTCINLCLISSFFHYI